MVLTTILIRNLELKCQCSYYYYYYYSVILVKSSQPNKNLCRPLNFFLVFLLDTENVMGDSSSGFYFYLCFS